MVVCAVRYEPVSDPKFPAKGHFAGNFEQNTRLCPTALVSCAVITRLTSSETRAIPLRRSEPFDHKMIGPVPFELFPFFPPMGGFHKKPHRSPPVRLEHSWPHGPAAALCCSRWSDDLGLFLVDIAAADSETGAGTFRPQDGLIYS